VLKKWSVTLPKKTDRKKPTHVDVHKTQLIRSPKNFDFDFIFSLVLSKIDPQTKIEVIPYDVKIHTNIAIYYFFIKY
jgi:hypothetical protein